MIEMFHISCCQDRDKIQNGIDFSHDIMIRNNMIVTVITSL